MKMSIVDILTNKPNGLGEFCEEMTLTFVI